MIRLVYFGPMSEPAAARPRLSIVVPFFNAASTLDQTLDSLLGLPDDVELVLSDNHSTDFSPSLAAEFISREPRARLVRPPSHYPNRRRNWEFGMREASGEWLVMLHADDLFRAKVAGDLLNTLVAAPLSAVLVAGRARLFGAGTDKVRPRWMPKAIVSGSRYRRFLAWDCSLFPFTAIRRDTFLAVGGFGDEFELVQDWDLWLRALARGDIVLSPLCWGSWRQHPVSATYAEIFDRECNELRRRNLSSSSAWRLHARLESTGVEPVAHLLSKVAVTAGHYYMRSTGHLTTVCAQKA